MVDKLVPQQCLEALESAAMPACTTWTWLGCVIYSVCLASKLGQN
jgi:hypothetical protein